MTAGDLVHDGLKQLLDELDADLAALDRICGEIDDVMGEMAHTPPHRHVLAFLALQLDRYYTAAESTFQRVARVFDHALPNGEDWHQRLLGQVAGEAPGLRPAVIGDETRADLDELRRFRHFLRHAYSVDLDWNGMENVVAILRHVHPDVTRELRAFRVFVVRCLEEAD